VPGEGDVTVKIRYLVAGAAALATLRVLSDRVARIERRVRQEAIESPEITRGFLRVSEMPQMRLMRAVVARRAVGGLQDGRVLDMGSGPGHLAIGMAHLAPKLAVIGLDLSDPMLDLAAANAAGAGVGDRVTFIKADAADVPYPDGSFDLIVSTLSLHHWADPVAVFEEVARLLRPGSRFLIADLRRDVVLPAWLLLWFATHVVVPPALRRAGEPMGSREAAYTPDEVVALLTRSRLQDWKVTSGPMWLAVESLSGVGG
jgi:ubiquinone/menaquinone biosynthesis C-methylase UbiE